MSESNPGKLRTPQEAAGASFRAPIKTTEPIPNRADGILGDTNVTLKPGCLAQVCFITQTPSLEIRRVTCEKPDCDVRGNFAVTKANAADGKNSDNQIQSMLNRLCQRPRYEIDQIRDRGTTE